LLIDDFGWADGSWHREKGYKEVQSPHMQQLVDTGIELTRNCKFIAAAIVAAAETRWARCSLGARALADV